MLCRKILISCGPMAALSVCAIAGDRDADKPKLLDGEPKLIVVNGYSTSFHWPNLLQRKLDKYFEGKRVIEIKSATQGGTPIAKWMDLETGDPLEPWSGKLRPMLQESIRPTAVLGQQSLQWAFGDRSAGIRDTDDEQNIRIGAEAIRRYVDLLLKDGADEVFLAMHIYKHGMEPQIGNERFALAEYLKLAPAKVHAGPDVWEPTSKVWPQAFQADKVHPNEMGAEIMAHYWFAALLKHDGLAVPAWSGDEMQQAMASPPRQVADGIRGQRGSGVPSRPPRSQAQQGGRPTFDMLLQRHDANQDGKVTKGEFRGPAQFFSRMDSNGDGTVTRREFESRGGSPDRRRIQSGPGDNRPSGDMSSRMKRYEVIPTQIPAPGDMVPSFELRDLRGNTVSLDQLLTTKPVMIETGSYTCPVFRGRHASIERLHDEYGGKVHLIVLYGKEAHPESDRFKRIKQPSRNEERIELATQA